LKYTNNFYLKLNFNRDIRTHSNKNSTDYSSPNWQVPWASRIVM